MSRFLPLITSLASFLVSLRNRHFAFGDAVILIVAPIMALILRLDAFDAPLRFAEPLLFYIVVSLIIYWSVFYWWELYARYWRYASLQELILIGEAVLIATLMLMTVFYTFRSPAFMAIYTTVPILDQFAYLSELPRSVPVIASLLIIFLTGFSRFTVRLAENWQRMQQRQGGQRVLIMGAGEAGVMLARELERNPQVSLEAVGFLDDDPSKKGVRIQGLLVLGDRLDIPEVSRSHRVKQVIIAMPTAPGNVIREIKELCASNNLQTKIIPGIYELLDGTVSVKQLRDVDIEDLLRREPVQTDTAAIQSFLQGKRVLVTGAGGSIGSELCRQILRCHPAQLTIVGHGENSIFSIQNELLRTMELHQPVPIQTVIADIRFADRVRHVFDCYQPEVIFHAAAHKHVPLMEANPVEAITNNVFGTRNLLAAAQAVGVERFVMISTDKAVNPTSVMGASKRMAELLLHQAALESGRPYVAVRFGNVLGSRGSVVLTFKQQIAAGGPVTVTDPEMTRFFMTIPEAVQLLLQASVLGQGGEVFLLDMGEPVKIIDLARDLIRLSGLEIGQDINIAYTGLRPGEKLFEELFVSGEVYKETAHEKIFTADKAANFVISGLAAAMTDLQEAVNANDDGAVVAILHRLIPEYRQPSPPAGQETPPASQPKMPQPEQLPSSVDSQSDTPFAPPLPQLEAAP